MTAIAPVFFEEARRASTQGEPFLLALQRLSGLDADVLIRVAEQHAGMPALSLARMEQMTPDFGLLDYADCLRRQCIILMDDADGRFFVASDPFDDRLFTWASYHIEAGFRVAFSHPLEIRALLSRLEEHQQVLSQLIRLETETGGLEDSEEISLASIAQDESQVVRFVNSTLYDAHKAGASDIHFENTAQGLVIKYRIDGVLAEARRLPDVALTDQVISRIKVMAELDIGEKRIPQDGRFAVTMAAREIDFRVSIMPGLFGEDAVLRILDRQSLTAEAAQLSLDILGFDEDTRSIIRRLAMQPYGMLLVTGPTGSGKTTSLYATLSEINKGNDKIITIEDPVEYQLPGVLQIPVNEKKGLDFARGLRSILRHDPDRILVGEIRDQETAEIAVQAALTGHLVFTSVHANSVFDVISRFHHMGVDPYSFVTALNGIVAQRLVRLICTHCVQAVTPDEMLLKDSGLSATDTSQFTFRHGSGCMHCRGTGYKGRRALAEVLVLGDEMRQMILQQSPLAELKAWARRQGMVSMREQALRAVQAGQTTLQEINRVTFVE